MVERPWHKAASRLVRVQNRFWLEGEEEKLLRLVTDSEAEWVKAETERMQRARKQVREREVRPVKGECRIRVARRERMEEEEVLLWIRSDRRLTVEQKGCAHRRGRDRLVPGPHLQFVGDGWRIAHCFPEAEPVVRSTGRPGSACPIPKRLPPSHRRGMTAGGRFNTPIFGGTATIPDIAGLMWTAPITFPNAFTPGEFPWIFPRCGIAAGGIGRDLWSYSWAVAHRSAVVPGQRGRTDAGGPGEPAGRTPAR